MPSFLPHHQLRDRRDLLSLMLCSQYFHQCLEHRRCPSNYGINFSQFLSLRESPFCSLWIQDVPQRVTERHRGE